MQHKGYSVAAAFAENGIGWEGGDGSAQRGRQSVMYDCLVDIATSTRQRKLFRLSLSILHKVNAVVLCIAYVYMHIGNQMVRFWGDRL